jgi:hypothetical protein
MIEKIYIPTVHRVDNQLTYNSLSDELKKKVVLVVQAWERPQYKYDCEYLVLPDTEEYHYSHYYCLSKTRKYIYYHANTTKYAVFDDDMVFGRRNSKYFKEYGGNPNMDKSKRPATPEDLLDMFSVFDKWLDEVAICGCTFTYFPPGKKLYKEIYSLTNAFFINGELIYPYLDKMNLTATKISEDIVFMLHLLAFGFKNRLSEEFVILKNSSFDDGISSTCWDTQRAEQSLNDYRTIEKMFPEAFKIVYDENGNCSGGYRDHGLVRIDWKKAYKCRVKTTSFSSLFDASKNDSENIHTNSK